VGTRWKFGPVTHLRSTVASAATKTAPTTAQIRSGLLVRVVRAGALGLAAGTGASGRDELSTIVGFPLADRI